MSDAGDRVVRTALGRERRSANRRRLRGVGVDEFSLGLAFGQVITADNHLDADPLLVMGAKNELHFLARYTDARA